MTRRPPPIARAAWLAWAALGVALAIGIATASACSPHASSSAVARPAPSTARAAATIVAGTSGDYPPLSLWREGEPVGGFAPALLEAFCARGHVDLRWSRFRWPELAGDMHAGAFDVAADGITVTPERSISGRFTVPIARGGAVLLLRRPAWAASVGEGVAAIDRHELRVVVNRGGYLERVARRLLPDADVRAIADNAGVREAFARGEADAAMTNTFEAPRWRQGLDGVEALGPLTTDVTALWVRADHGELAEELDAWLLDREANGELAAERARWLGPAAGDATARPVDALLAATAERLALMPFVAAAKAHAAKAVEDRAQEERVLASARAAVARARAKLPPAASAPSPSDDRVDAFFRAEIEAAKLVQSRTAAPPDASFSLDADLRPAIARVTAKMAFLVARLSHADATTDARGRARVWLADTGLPADVVDRLADAIVDLVR